MRPLSRAAETSLAAVATLELQLEAQQYCAAVAMPVKVFTEYNILYDQMRLMARTLVYGMRKQHKVPATWWDHLKLALNRRWPRLKLQVDMQAIDVMALFPELQVVRERQAIWYASQPAVSLSEESIDE